MCEVPKIESQTMVQALMNLVNTTLFQKYLDPLLKMSIYVSTYPYIPG